MDARKTWPAVLGALIRGEHLTADESAWAMNEIMEGAATPAQIAGFGVALRIKGETAVEVTGLAGFATGPSTLNTVGTPSSRRGTITCRSAG